MTKFIREKDISKVISNRLGFDFEAQNTQELNEFINEITPVLNAEWSFGDNRALTAKEYWDSYDAVSPNCFINILLSKVDASKFVEKYDVNEDFMYSNEQEEDCYDSLEEVPTENIFVIVPSSDIAEDLSKCKDFSAGNNCKFDVKIENYYSLGESEQREPIKITFHNGEIIGGGIIYFPLDNEEILVADARWLTYITKSIKELEQFGIYAMFSGKDTGSHMKLDDSYLTKAIVAKYTNKSLVNSEDEAIEFVNKAPVIINYINEKYITKDVVLAFVTSNKQYIYLYKQKYVSESGEKREFYRSKLVNGVHPEYDFELNVNLSGYLDDEKILVELIKSGSRIQFEENAYDEKLITKLLNEKYNLVYPLYEYWVNEIDKDKKTDTKIRIKYNLMLSDADEVVAFCKCYDIITNINTNKMELLASLVFDSCDYFYKMVGDNADKYLRTIINLVDKDVQQYIASKYLMLVNYMKPENVDEKLAEYVAKNCSCAGNILPDEYVLKYNLKVEDIDLKDSCRSCRFCTIKQLIG